MDKENKLILYKDEEGRVSVNTRFADEDVWLTQEQLATIYQTTQENVSMHITNIYTDNELDKEGTYKKFLLVRQEGKRKVRRKHTGAGTLSGCSEFPNNHSIWRIGKQERYRRVADGI